MSSNTNNMRRIKPRPGKKLDEGQPVFETEDYNEIPVNQQRGAIRILKVDPGELQQPAVYCELVPGTIVPDEEYLPGENREVNFRPYDALSWCWGNVSANDKIFIRKGDLTFVKYVQQDLVKALRALRHKTEARYIWVDAVCINQDYGPEKNVQVEMMAEIYGRADCVRIWLGDSDASSDTAIRFIKEEILQLQHFDELTRNTGNSGKWEALLKLMQRDWFSRRWVVQEVTLAQRAMIHCGGAKIAWRKFAVAVELFVEVESATHRLSEVMKESSKYQHIPREFEHISHLGASLLVDAAGKLFREYDYFQQSKPKGKKQFKGSRTPSRGNNILQYDSEDEDNATEFDPVELDGQKSRVKGQPLLTLEYLVSSMSIFGVTNNHDSIYALLGIAKDTTPTAVNKKLRTTDHTQAALEVFTAKKQYTVSYEADYIDICKDFIEFCVQQNVRRDPSRALDVICRPWAVEDVETNGVAANLPSWLPTLDRASFGMDRAPGIGGLRMGRKNADSLVGLPNVTHRNYNAAETKGLDTKTFRFRKRMKPATLATKTHLPHGSTGVDLQATPRAQPDHLQTFSRASLMENQGHFSGQQPHVRHEATASKQNEDSTMINGTTTSDGPAIGGPSFVARSNNTEQIQAQLITPSMVLDHFSLFVKGFILDTITSVQTASQSGSIPTAWAEFAGWDMEGTPPEYFWRSLVADRGSDGKNPPVYYAKACEESFRKGGKISGVVETAGLIEYERNSVVAQFCRRVQSAIWNRALVQTRSERLGLVSKDVIKGDMICILYGCSVPVVLRRSGPKPDDVVEKEMKDELRYIVDHVVQSYRTHLARREVFREKREKDKAEYKEWENKMRATWREDEDWKQHWRLVRAGLVRVHEFRAWYLNKWTQTLSAVERKGEVLVARGLVKVLLSQIHDIARWAAERASKQQESNNVEKNQKSGSTIIEQLMQSEDERSIPQAFEPTEKQMQLWKLFMKDEESAKEWRRSKSRYFDEKGFVAWARQDPGRRPIGYSEDKVKTLKIWKRAEHQAWTKEWVAENSWFLCIDSFRGWLRDKAKWHGTEEEVDERQEWERDDDWQDRHGPFKSSEESFEEWSKYRKQWADDVRWHAARASDCESSSFKAYRNKSKNDAGAPQLIQFDPERAAHDKWLQERQLQFPRETFASEQEAWREEWKSQVAKRKQADDLARKLEQNADKKDNEPFVERWKLQYKPPVVDWTEFQLALHYGRHWLRLVKRRRKDHMEREELKWNSRRAIKLRQEDRRARLRDQYGYEPIAPSSPARKPAETAKDETRRSESHTAGTNGYAESSIASPNNNGTTISGGEAVAGATDISRRQRSHQDTDGAFQFDSFVDSKPNMETTSHRTAEHHLNGEQRLPGSANEIDESDAGTPRPIRRARTFDSSKSGVSDGPHRRNTMMTEEEQEEYQKNAWVERHDNLMKEMENGCRSREDLMRWIDLKRSSFNLYWKATMEAIDEQYKTWNLTCPRALVKANTYRRDYSRPRVARTQETESDDGEDEEDSDSMKKQNEAIRNELPRRSKYAHLFAYKERARLSPIGEQSYMAKVEEKFKKHSGEDAKWWYQMMGECYVHGMMDGEAMKHQNEEGIVSTVFEIR